MGRRVDQPAGSVVTVIRLAKTDSDYGTSLRKKYIDHEEARGDQRVLVEVIEVLDITEE